MNPLSSERRKEKIRATTELMDFICSLFLLKNKKRNIELILNCSRRECIYDSDEYSHICFFSLLHETFEKISPHLFMYYEFMTVRFLLKFYGL